MIKVLKKGYPRTLTTHLEQKEFDCKCERPECTITLFDSSLGLSFRLLRLELNCPIAVNSGYRCAAHNQDTVGSAFLSLHQAGRAIDLSCPDSVDFDHFADACKGYFKKTIEYPESNFVHCQN